MTEVDTPAVPARLLAYAPGHTVAFAQHCAVALAETPEIFEVPGQPAHCLGLIEWAGKLVPLIDLHLLIAGSTALSTGVPGHVLILSWQAESGHALQYGAVCAPSLVTGALVSDADRCEMPADVPVLATLAFAFFLRGDCVVPIIDTRRLFGTRISQDS
ncbi:chemotaxis protein CheW [Caenimonas aquaedulcis]|uniref:Chemotaxis protein CheW n=1 Tax=Caenimonas aquaedulcis TaxID=2793270 RepID=A0A931H6Z1_9BURK|nr:chemotaxis protein CheW [Caenimonas aquaedulcis]MBG9389572.1 chemotaxis protein CheW [Caenimonas aquaedulcis]